MVGVAAQCPHQPLLGFGHLIGANEQTGHEEQSRHMIGVVLQAYLAYFAGLLQVAFIKIGVGQQSVG